MMKIETKFDVGDVVYLLSDNIVKTVTINVIKIIHTNKDFFGITTHSRTSVLYGCKEGTGFIHESKIFKTKEELLNSL